MKVVLSKGPKSELSTLVVFCAKDKKSGKPTSAKVSAAIQSLVDAAHSDAKFSGDKKESIFFRQCGADGHKNVLLVGLGEAGSITGESVRVAAAVTFGALKNHKVTSAGILGDSLFKFVKESGLAIQGFDEGLELTAYEFTDLKGKANKAKKGSKRG